MKKMTNRSVQERLENWIKDDHYSVISNRLVHVEEKRDDGAAEVICTLPSGQAFELLLEGKAITHLKSQKCADGILLIECSQGTWELHIIECKRTVNSSKWGKVKLQFEASIQRAMALVASIGIFPEKIKVYTAFREEPIQDQIQADPILSKMTVEEWRALSTEEREKLHYMDWLDAGIEIWTKEYVPHEKVVLDDHGSAPLAVQGV